MLSSNKKNCAKRYQMICPNDEVVMVAMKETKTAYIITPISEPPVEHFDYYLNSLWELGKMVIKKGGGKHGLTNWGNGEYTLYPYRSGLPYLLRPESGQ